MKKFCARVYPGTQDTVIVVRDTIIPQAVVDTVLFIDSLINLLPGDTIILSDPKQKVLIKFWRDKFLNQLHISAIRPKDTIRLQTKIIRTHTIKYEKKPKTSFQIFKDWFVVIALSLLVVHVIVRAIFKK